MTQTFGDFISVSQNHPNMDHLNLFGQFLENLLCKVSIQKRNMEKTMWLISKFDFNNYNYLLKATVDEQIAHITIDCGLEESKASNFVPNLITWLGDPCNPAFFKSTVLKVNHAIKNPNTAWPLPYSISEHIGPYLGFPIFRESYLISL